MAATDIKNLEKLVKEVLEEVKGNGDKPAEGYSEALEKINDKLTAMEDKLSSNVTADKISEEIISKVEEIKDKFEKQSDDFVNELHSKIEKFHQNGDVDLSEPYSNVSDSIKDFVSIITNEMMELKAQFEKFNTEFTDINLNTNMAISKEVVSMKNCMLSLNDAIDSIKAKLENYNLEEALPPVISGKVTENVTKEMNDLIASYFNGFKNEVFVILAKISDGITAVLNNDKIVEGLEVSIGEVIHNQQKNKEDILKIIKNNISEENKKILPQILQMINSISFDNSAEEIKDGLFAINENLGVVNKNIASSAKVSEQIKKQFTEVNKNVAASKSNIIDVVQNDIGDKLSEINKSIDSLSQSDVFDKINKIDYTVDNLTGNIEKSEIINKISKIDSVLESVSAEFDIITKGSKIGTGEYFYTLLDLESDISKVRIILDELNNTIQDDRSLAESVTKNLSDKIANVNSFIEKTSKLYADPDYKSILQQFDALNDDITSISKRTNKLILTSDDSAVKLQKNIEAFQNIMKKISTTVENFENSTVLRAIAERTVVIQKLLKNSLQADNAMNEAFIYLASWIDSTSEQIEFIKQELAEIKEKSYDKNFDEVKKAVNTGFTTVNNNITSLDFPDFDISKIEKLIKDSNKKYVENLEKMNILEEKVDTLINQMKVVNESSNVNKANVKKIDKIEKQIQQLLSYVEEE